MLHKMKLQNYPFQKIKTGNKTIEMRLNDEKRRKINKGDIIEFQNVVTNEIILCEVNNLFYYKNFSELYNNHDKISIGYEKDDVVNPDDMLKYYEQEKIKKYGVVGIQIKLISNSITPDIEIDNLFGSFKFRVGLVLIKDNKLLCVKSKRFDGYVFPGGHVELGELACEAALREGKEELNTEIEIKNLLCINENIYYQNNKPYNEIVNYYLITVKNDLPTHSFVIEEMDKGIKKIHQYEWLEIKKLKEYNLRPLGVANLIKNDIESNQILVTRN